MFSAKKIKPKTRRKVSKVIKLTIKSHMETPFPSMPKSIPKKPVIISQPQMGLTPKERSIVISTCQKRSSRYSELKSLAFNAMNRNKVYVVYGYNMAIRRALNARGWVEKIPQQSMNLNKIYKPSGTKECMNKELEKLLLSNLVEKHTPNFMWKIKDIGTHTTALNDYHDTIINKLKMDTVWATKQGLCSSVKNNSWFHIDRVAETHTPRTYDSKDDVEEFTRDFMLTACTSLLKWILRMADHQKSISTETGKISKNILIFALNRCKEFLLRKQNKDLDYAWYSVSAKTWNEYLKNYYKLVTEEEQFEEVIGKKVTLYNAYAKIMLVEIQKYRPQVKCEGFQNLWILKPGHCSRGRGIRLASKLTDINNLLSRSSQRKVIQKYIEEPLLIHKTKFDIRQYYLVTGTFPLIIWMYKDCYLKFSSQKYTLNNYHESVHLTNNAVQKKYTNCPSRHPELPTNNMWSLERYKEYLTAHNKQKVWDEIVYPSMKKSIVGVMLSSQDHMSPCKNRFELYGCDFVLDEDYMPWLIEINSCPDLNPTTKITAQICPAVVEDIVKVVIDRPNMVSADTGKFECAYRQPMTNPVFSRTAELHVIGHSLPKDYFCKSSIVHEPFDSSVDVDRECDIQNTFKQLKCLYEQDELDNKEKEVRSASEQELDLKVKIFGSKLALIESLPSSPINSDDSSLPSSPKDSDDSIKFTPDSSVTIADDNFSDKTSEDETSIQSYFSEIDLSEGCRKPRRNKSPSLVILNQKYSGEISSFNVAERMIHSMSHKVSMVAHEHCLHNKFMFNKTTGFNVYNELVNIPSHASNATIKPILSTAASRILSYISGKIKSERN